MTPKKYKQWAEDMFIAHAFCEPNGLMIEYSKADYLVAKIIGDGIKIVIYPHKTSAGHQHLRLRDEGSKDPVKAYGLMVSLDRAAGFNCTFQMKNKWANARSLTSPTNTPEPQKGEKL